MSDLETISAQLRHAYLQLHAGTVKDQRAFANGLIAPQIRKLERMNRRDKSSEETLSLYEVVQRNF